MKQNYFSINCWDQMIYKKGTKKIPHSRFGRINRRCKTKQILGFSHNAKAMEPPREYKHLGNPPRKESGGEYAKNRVFPGDIQRPTSLYQYSTQATKGVQHLEGEGWQTKIQNTAIECSSNLWKSFCKFFQDLISKKDWSQETRQHKVSQNTG